MHIISQLAVVALLITVLSLLAATVGAEVEKIADALNGRNAR